MDTLWPGHSQENDLPERQGNKKAELGILRPAAERSYSEQSTIGSVVSVAGYSAGIYGLSQVPIDIEFRSPLGTVLFRMSAVIARALLRNVWDQFFTTSQGYLLPTLGKLRPIFPPPKLKNHKCKKPLVVGSSFGLAAYQIVSNSIVEGACLLVG